MKQGCSVGSQTSKDQSVADSWGFMAERDLGDLPVNLPIHRWRNKSWARRSHSRPGLLSRAGHSAHLLCRVPATQALIQGIPCLEEWTSWHGAIILHTLSLPVPTPPLPHEG